MNDKPMTKGERDQLAKLARQRAKLAKMLVTERERVLTADIEDQLSAQHQADDALWRDAIEVAKAAVAEADEQVAAACQALGLPEGFRPRLSIGWQMRGENKFPERRAELRRLAEARIKAAGQSARTTIDTKLLDVETELIREGLTSEAAIAWLEAMPDPESLMPRVDLDALAAGERQPWTAPAGLAANMLTPSTASQRHEAQQVVAALTGPDRPELDR